MISECLLLSDKPQSVDKDHKYPEYEHATWFFLKLGFKDSNKQTNK